MSGCGAVRCRHETTRRSHDRARDQHQPSRRQPHRDHRPARFASVRVVTDDVPGLVRFYEQVTGAAAAWATEVFAELVTDAATLAIAGSETMALFGCRVAHAADNRTVIIEFLVPDVDADHERIVGLGPAVSVVQPPTTMPWGNRSLLLRDPDGNLVNLFTPVTAEAVARLTAAGAAGRAPAR